jgi:hypothetical protein
MNWGKTALVLFLVGFLLAAWHVDFEFSFPAQSTPSSIAATIDAICLPPIGAARSFKHVLGETGARLDGKSMPSRR